MDRIEVVIDLPNPLDRMIFSFWLNNNFLVLDTYRRQTKVKRTWKTVALYDRLSDRNSTITENEVPLDQDVKLKALEAMVNKLSVVTWSELKKLK
jgi:hypothetical protein